VVPHLDGAADPFLSDLKHRAARIPADPALPAHHSFRPAQVLLHDSGIGFIDFDGFCHAEPARDVALFRATTRDLAMSVLPEDTPLQARLLIVDDLCEYFLARYRELAPISRERVAVWEALDLFTNVLHSWTKAKPRRLARSLTLLRHHALSLRTLTASP
jgi:aminoglycoside phosphotransferase (APT) family kinase protein